MEPPPKPSQKPILPILSSPSHHAFQAPVKKIHTGPDVQSFLTSTAYRDIGLFVLQLNRALCPRKHVLGNGREVARTFTLDTVSEAKLPASVRNLRMLLRRVEEFMDEAPPDEGPRRFGNVSFRVWYGLLEGRVDGLLGGGFLKIDHDERKAGKDKIEAKNEEGVGKEAAQEDDEKEEKVPGLEDELRAYLLGAFGSPQRLDYGTGHELSFLAFLGCLWKVGYFQDGTPEGEIERNIVLGVFEPYLKIIRRLIQTYTLEPAGSHGVWGLDDHSFLPYIFGSAQLTRPISDSDPMPLEGSVKGAPKTGDILEEKAIQREREKNMYFSAVGFINDVKTGPFWEHSPILFDVSGVQDGWGKINKGMIKMFNAEVLSKFPVVQHFPFGSLFSWTPDPDALEQAKSVHLANQPKPSSTTATTGLPQNASPSAFPLSSTSVPPTAAGTAAPWAQATSMPAPAGPGIPYSKAPWAAGGSSGSAPVPARAPAGAPARGSVKARMEARTEAMRQKGLYPQKKDESEAPSCPMKGQAVSVTKAPWAE